MINKKYPFRLKPSVLLFSELDAGGFHWRQTACFLCTKNNHWITVLTSYTSHPSGEGETSNKHKKPFTAIEFYEMFCTPRRTVKFDTFKEALRLKDCDPRRKKQVLHIPVWQPLDDKAFSLC